MFTEHFKMLHLIVLHSRKTVKLNQLSSEKNPSE